MKIINQRGDIVTSEQFKRRLAKLISSALEATDLEPIGEEVDDKEQSRTPCSPLPKQEAAQSVKAIGLDTSTKLGQAAAGASMLTSIIAAGVKRYEKKKGKALSRESMKMLESKLIQFAAGMTEEEEKVKKGKAEKGKVKKAPKRGEIKEIGEQDKPKK